ncbi:VPLPA-CTERM sorting domain-containing protein [Pseudodesulfovibrio sp. zrk46]|uniref:VPLPA-CTERM sorting domain-containing protein n=1 Tax=Pseudodesulfovibrio sp. zrk46 TaxID=2725288 RepID=UPI001448C3B0|nr:VPLPA-CTERM sorting domain-containing protein [Pseudodesulfovibrio sp. zrk46]QJB58307.1 hypothetical protein HFN16_18820 [Pseudodesulfovibrio sp. zrk46]
MLNRPLLYIPIFSFLILFSTVSVAMAALSPIDDNTAFFGRYSGIVTYENLDNSFSQMEMSVEFGPDSKLVDFDLNGGYLWVPESGVAWGGKGILMNKSYPNTYGYVENLIYTKFINTLQGWSIEGPTVFQDKHPEFGYMSFFFDGTFTQSLGEFAVSGTFDKTSPTPIPGAVWLLGSGLVGLVGFRRKRAA